MTNISIRRWFAAILLLATLPAAPRAVLAVPSYARQTGVSCAACHLSYPELTSFGRIFKLNGYVQSSEQKIGEGTDNLSLNANLPISAMLVTSYSQLRKADVDGMPGLERVRNSNDVVMFPEEFSLFYAGRISPSIGTFLQVTYDGAGNAFAMDNTDIRFVSSSNLGGSILTYGLTLNNNPTVQDLWNSTPAWGFPFASSPLTPGPAASIQLDGNLGQQVAGLGAYAGLLSGSWLYFAEMTLYKTALLGVEPPPNLTSAPDSIQIQNYATYWRLAVEKNFGTSTWEFGALGMNATYISNADANAAAAAANAAGETVHRFSTNRFSDYGVDSQYQYVSSENQVSLKALWLHETNDWGKTSAPNHTGTRTTLTTERLTLSYYRSRSFGINVQEFLTTGSKDAAYGTSTGSPDTVGQLLEFVYTPWLNTRFSLAYTNFNKFNGLEKNYDGAGRNAADNNTVYLVSWLMF